jgi:hypothetical protein
MCRLLSLMKRRNHHDRAITVQIVRLIEANVTSAVKRLRARCGRLLLPLKTALGQFLPVRPEAKFSRYQTVERPQMLTSSVRVRRQFGIVAVHQPTHVS